MKSASLALVIAAFGFSETSHAQGQLTPPSGVPAPVMKTLDQIEPRTPIPASPAVPVAGPHFTITQPGSYYLTGNVTVSSGSGIVINSGGVTLDLNGFSILSTASPSGGVAIRVNLDGANPTGGTVIRNGHIRPSAQTGTGTGFRDGVIAVGAEQNTVVRDVIIERLTGDAINLVLSLGGALVENCSVTDIGGDGITSFHVISCSALRIQGQAISGTVISNSTGKSLGTEPGIGGTTITNSVGSSVSGVGIGATSVSNCQGSSTSGVGIIADTALNSYGNSSSGSAGLQVSGTASFCRGSRDGGVAIQAGIAVACTVDGTGTVSSTQKHLGTP
jgi:hypothetical protein